MGDEVERAAAQLCDEMELREVIPSWDLLYQIILARESARQMSPKSDRLGVYSEIVVSGAFAPSELPKAESALIRKLVRTDDASTRREMLFETMESARIENEKLSEEGRKQHEEGRIKLTKTTRGFTEREEISDEELMLKFPHQNFPYRFAPSVMDAQWIGRKRQLPQTLWIICVRE